MNETGSQGYISDETVPSRRSPKNRGRVYFICDGEAIKIGFSTNPAKRMEILQIGSSAGLRMVGAIKAFKTDEGFLHERFEHLRIGGEWFRIEDDLLDYIEALEKRSTWLTPEEVLDGRSVIRNVT